MRGRAWHEHVFVGKASRVRISMPPEYRWMAEGDASPWFRDCKPYRQNLDRSWSDARSRLGADLADKGSNAPVSTSPIPPINPLITISRDIV